MGRRSERDGVVGKRESEGGERGGDEGRARQQRGYSVLARLTTPNGVAWFSFLHVLARDTVSARDDTKCDRLVLVRAGTSPPGSTRCPTLEETGSIAPLVRRQRRIKVCQLENLTACPFPPRKTFLPRLISFRNTATVGAYTHNFKLQLCRTKQRP